MRRRRSRIDFDGYMQPRDGLRTINPRILATSIPPNRPLDRLTIKSGPLSMMVRNRQMVFAAHTTPAYHRVRQRTLQLVGNSSPPVRRRFCSSSWGIPLVQGSAALARRLPRSITCLRKNSFAKTSNDVPREWAPGGRAVPTRHRAINVPFWAPQHSSHCFCEGINPSLRADKGLYGPIHRSVGWYPLRGQPGQQRPNTGNYLTCLWTDWARSTIADQSGRPLDQRLISWVAIGAHKTGFTVPVWRWYMYGTADSAWCMPI